MKAIYSEYDYVAIYPDIWRRGWKTEKKVSDNVKDRVMQGEKISLMEEAPSGRERGQDSKGRRTDLARKD